MKYRKKPIVVEAVQFDPFGVHQYQLPKGVSACGTGDNYGYEGTQFWVTTIQGVRTPITPGEWVILEADGEHAYPCAADVFAATYDPVEETSS